MVTAFSFIVQKKHNFLKLILLVASINVNAETAIYTGAWSHHFNEPDHDAPVKEFNENNKLFAIEYNGTITGTFKNSFNQRTYFLAHTYNYHGFVIGGSIQKGYTRNTCPTTYKEGLCFTPLIAYNAPIPLTFIMLKDGISIAIRLRP